MRADVLARLSFRGSGPSKPHFRCSHQGRPEHLGSAIGAIVQELESRLLLSAAVSASLIKTVNPDLADAYPEYLTASTNELYFAANNTQLWKTDGTPAGTRMLPNPVSGTLTNLTDVNGKVFFEDSVSYGPGGDATSLVRTDGTAAGTFVLANVDGYSPITTVNGLAYFFGSIGGTTGLYKSDGTAGGTVFVAQVAAAYSATESNGELFFTIANTLWKSDGTTAGTVEIETLAGAQARVVSGNGRLFIMTSSSPSNPLAAESLWVSDGTAAGTSQVEAFQGAIGPPAIWNGAVYFSVDNNFHSSQLGIWKTDGTPAGTLLVVNVPRLDGTATFGVLNNALYFVAGSADNQWEGLWRTDGTAHGTSDVTSILGNATLWAGQLVTFDGNLYFSADDGKHGIEVWRSDGTAAGTEQVTQVNSTLNQNTLIPAAITIGDETYFSLKETYVWGDEGLWETDGTAAGTMLVPNAPMDANDPVNADGTLYFVGNHAVWKSDGTAAGVVLVDQFPASIDVGDLVPIGNEVYFATSGPDQPFVRTIYRTDGTAAGTQQLAQLTGGVMNGAGNTLFFTSGNSDNQMELEKIDPGSGQVVLLQTFAGPIAQYADLTAVGDQAYFLADDGVHGEGIWEVSATTAPVMVYAPGTHGNGNGFKSDLYDFDNALYFSDPAVAAGLFRVDPNTLQASQVSTYTASNMIAANGMLYFQQSQEVPLYSQAAIEVTNGQPSPYLNAIGVSADVSGGLTFPTYSYSTDQLLAYDNQLYFIATPYTPPPADPDPYAPIPAPNQQLWQVNGTVATLADPAEGSIGWTADALLGSTSNGMVFLGSDPQHGEQLWVLSGKGGTSSPSPVVLPSPPTVPTVPPPPTVGSALQTPSTLLPALGKVSLPSDVVAGSPLGVNVPVVVTNTGAAIRGKITVDLFADTGTNLTANQVLLSTKSRSASLKTNQKAPFAFNVKSLPAVLQDGSYHLIAEVIDPAGDTNAVATSQTVQVAARVVQPLVAVSAVTPLAIAPARGGSVVVTVTNTGNVAASGGTITLSLSSDGKTSLPGLTLDTVQKGLAIPAGKSRRFVLRFRIPRDLVAGTYFPSVLVSLDGMSAMKTGNSAFTVK